MRKIENAFERNSKIELWKRGIFKALEISGHFASQAHTCAPILKCSYTSSVFEIYVYFLTSAFTEGLNLREENHNLWKLPSQRSFILKFLPLLAVWKQKQAFLNKMHLLAMWVIVLVVVKLWFIFFIFFLGGISLYLFLPMRFLNTIFHINQLYSVKQQSHRKPRLHRSCRVLPLSIAWQAN